MSIRGLAVPEKESCIYGARFTIAGRLTLIRVFPQHRRRRTSIDSGIIQFSRAKPKKLQIAAQNSLLSRPQASISVLWLRKHFLCIVRENVPSSAHRAASDVRGFPE